MHLHYRGGALAHHLRLPVASILLSALAAGPARAQDGGASLLWQAEIETEVPHQDTDGLVVSAGGRFFLAAIGGGKELEAIAYDAVTSASVWSADVVLPADIDQLSDFAVSPDGTRLYAALGGSGTPPADSLLVGLDAATGAVLFEQVYAPPSSGGCLLRALAVSPDASRVYAAGGLGDFGIWYEQFATAAFDAGTGQLLWEAFYDGTPGDRDEAMDVGVSPDGWRVFVTGVSTGFGTHDDYFTIAYTAAGARQWMARYNTGAWDRAAHVAVSPADSSVLVVGEASNGDEIVAYEPSTGTVLWTSTVETTEAAYHAQPVFAVDGAAAYVQARMVSDGDTDARVARLSAADGAVIWMHDHSVPFTGPYSSAAPRGLVVSPGGERVFAAVDSPLSGLGPQGAATLALRASDGALEWEAHDTASAPGSLWSEGIALSGDGARLAVAAMSGEYPAPIDQLLLVRAAASGAGLWQAVLDGQSAAVERARSVAAAPDGSRSTVGVVTTGVGDSYIDLFAFDAGGAPLWSVRDQGPSQPAFPDAVPVHVAYAPSGATVYASHLDGAGLEATAYDAATGAERWSTHLSGADPTGFSGLFAPVHDMVVDGVLGRAFVSRTYQKQMVLTALDPATGQVLWEASGGSTGLQAQAWALAVAPDGERVFVTGGAVFVPSQGIDMFTAAYDAGSGAPLWVATYASLGGPLEQVGRELAVSTDGAWVAARGGGDSLPVLAVYSAATGKEAWAQEISDGVPVSIAADGQSLLALVNGSPDLTVQAFGLATGGVKWKTVYDQAFDLGAALALERDGTTVFATGWTSDLPGAGLALTLTLTLALDTATGELLWTAAHDGGTSETGEALALDAAGHVLFVASTQDEGFVSLDDAHLAAYAVPSLVGQPGAFSAAAGGGQELFLRADAQHAGGVFLVMGSFAGTAPGFDVQGVHVPLNPDWYLPLSVNAAMSPVVGGLGLLDPEGKAKALVAVPPGVALTLVGMTVAHAYGVADPLTGTAEFASNPVLLAIEP